MPHLRDRWIVGLTAGRLVIALILLVVPTLVPIPGSDRVQPIAIFVPIAVAVPAALSLRERLAWLGTGVAARRLGILRMSTSFVADAVVLGTCSVLADVVSAPGVSLSAAVACAAAVEGVAYLTAVASVRFAWLVAATLGAIALLGLPPSGIPLAFSMPTWLGASVFVLGFVAYGLLSLRRIVVADPG
jgi:hypothetical protein